MTKKVPKGLNCYVRLGLAGTPNALWMMNTARGFFNAPPLLLPQLLLPQPVTREQFEALWNLYFYNFDPNNKIATECVDSEGRKAKLHIYYDPTQTVTPLWPQMGQQTSALVNIITPVVFERVDFSGKASVLRASVHPQGPLNLENGPELGTVSEFYSSTWQSNPQQTASWFSMLLNQKRESEVINPVVQEFGPLVKNLMVSSPTLMSAVYADVPTLKEGVPLSLISAGINKIVTILCAILTRGQGVVLIDEIENGIYYESFSFFWKTILSLAKSNQTQIFASTHSLECLRGLLPTIKGSEGDVLLLRAERGNGSSRITPIEGKLIEAAIEQGFDVR